MIKIHLILFAFMSFSIYSQGFQEISNQVGLNYIYPGISSDFQIEGGLLVFDYNNDGWDDIDETTRKFPVELTATPSPFLLESVIVFSTGELPSASVVIISKLGAVPSIFSPTIT
jgi:hypothetical protein